MKSIRNIWMAMVLLLSFTVSYGQKIKNATTETVKIYGNCEMCKATIEKAGNLKKVAKVDWNKDTKMATLTYDTKKTTQDQILKRIALAGYDCDKYLAPDDVYAKLQSCCQYERAKKAVAKKEVPKVEKQENTSPVIESLASTKTVIDNYFIIKDALVKSDANLASGKAQDLFYTINNIKMENLKAEEHEVWMKISKGLLASSEQISKTQDIEKQRNSFIDLSKSMYELIKVSKQETPTYFQHCPMANDGKGADWLSKEMAVRNPYYGSMMLTCGKVVETIK